MDLILVETSAGIVPATMRKAKVVLNGFAENIHCLLSDLDGLPENERLELLNGKQVVETNIYKLERSPG